MLQNGPILAVMNTTKTNKRIGIFHTSISAEVASLSIITIQLLVVCLTFKIPFTKIIDFFHMWVFVRTGMNFAHLASFQAIEFIDRPVPKMLDIFLRQTSENKTFFAKRSVL